MIITRENRKQQVIATGLVHYMAKSDNGNWDLRISCGNAVYSIELDKIEVDLLVKRYLENAKTENK